MIDVSVLYVTGAGTPDDATVAALESMGPSVTSATGPFDAVKRLDGERFDCVAVATPVEGMAVDQFVRTVRDTRPSVPILLVGGGDDAVEPDTVRGALAEGATGYVAGDVRRIVDRIHELAVDRRTARSLERGRALEGLVLDVATSLPDATDRAAIERLVYDRFSGADCYRFAWIGRYDPEADTVRMQIPLRGEYEPGEIGAVVGADDGGFARRAISDGTVTATGSDVGEEPADYAVGGTAGPPTPATGNYDSSSRFLAVPFVHGERTYGLLVIGTGRPGEPDGTERSILEDLGELVGYELERYGEVAPSTAGGDDGATDYDDERHERVAHQFAHEIRNTVGVVSARLALARNGSEEATDRAEAALADLERVADGMLSLVSGVEETGARDLAADVRDAREALVGDASEFHVEESGPIVADHDLVVILLANLFRNAVEHGSAPGADDEPGVVVRVGMLDDGFFVEDDGPGIPPDERDRVFEWGYASSDGGTGMGLSIVKGVAEAHGWTVDVTSGRDGGARFEMTGVTRPSD